VESCALNMTQALYSLVLAPLQMSYVDLLLLHHAGRWETDTNPHPPCFDASLSNGNGTCEFLQEAPPSQSLLLLILLLLSQPSFFHAPSLSPTHLQTTTAGCRLCRPWSPCWRRAW
jgi:hypothetical protein